MQVNIRGWFGLIYMSNLTQKPYDSTEKCDCESLGLHLPVFPPHLTVGCC